MGEGLMLPCPKIVRGQQQLTEEQEAYAREFARERIAAMLSTTPIDEREAEAHLRAAYRADRWEPPATIRWFDSPHSFVQEYVHQYVQGNLIENNIGVGHVEESYVPVCLWLAGMRRAGEIMGVNVSTSPSDIVRIDGSICVPAFSMPLDERNIVEAGVWQSMEAGVRNRVWTGISTLHSGDGSAYILWERVRDSMVAFYMARLFAFLRFFHELFEENKLIHMARFNEMVSGYKLESGEARVVRKPTVLKWDEQGRLHNDSGSCIQYRDGWGAYAWHGVSVPEKLILHPEQVSRQDWIQERNAEVRRAIQERLGNERFVQLVGGVCIDWGKRGRLIEIDLGPDDPERVAHYVQVQDSSTRRHYYLRVPPSITRADEAIAWTFGLDARGYQPGQET
ncbi:MAG: hypothetical protein JOZ18_02405 [Chloroflexi bacterium]|nr:hypothetical protein [Chloroflexota bacterium]